MRWMKKPGVSHPERREELGLETDHHPRSTRHLRKLRDISMVEKMLDRCQYTQHVLNIHSPYTQLSMSFWGVLPLFRPPLFDYTFGEWFVEFVFLWGICNAESVDECFHLCSVVSVTRHTGFVASLRWIRWIEGRIFRPCWLWNICSSFVSFIVNFINQGILDFIIFYPLVIKHSCGKSSSMGKPTISMVIFNSYFDITRGYIPIISEYIPIISH